MTGPTLDQLKAAREMLEKNDIKGKDFVVKGPVPYPTFIYWMSIAKSVTVT